MELKKIEVALVRVSKTNPRPAADYKGQDFKDLVASVLEKGVLMPILVRAVVGGYEIIAGERRYRAAKEVGAEMIPANVVEMNDIEAREAQIIENLQRADIHPLDEGKAYRELIEESGYDMEAVAAKIGKSVTYVRERLVLTNLIKKGQAMFREGLLFPSVASLIARCDELQQKDAIEWIEENMEWHGAPSTKAMRDWIAERVYADSMKNPPWTGDAEVQAALGGCDECKGQGGDLFGKSAAESCTNPTCYAQRMAAFIAIKTTAEPKLVKLSGSYSVPEGSLAIGKSSYKEITGKKDRCGNEERGIVIVGDGIGRIVEICRDGTCLKHWKESLPGGSYKASPEEKARRKKERAAEMRKREKDHEDTKTAVARMSYPISEKHLALLVDVALAHASHDILQGIAKRRELTVEKHADYHGNDYRAAIETLAKESKGKAKVGLLFELLLPSYSPYGNDRKKWMAKA